MKNNLEILDAEDELGVQVSERILTLEEEREVEQLSEEEIQLKEALDDVAEKLSVAQAQLKESLEELRMAGRLSNGELKKLNLKVTSAITVILGIVSYGALRGLLGGGYGAPSSVGNDAGLMEFMVATGALAAVVTPILAASYTIESYIMRMHPLKRLKKNIVQADVIALKEQFAAQMQEYERQVALSREIVTNALVRGGAIMEDGKLTVTPEQIELARKEMEDDLVSRNESQ